MLQLVRTNSHDQHFIQLVKALDEDLKIRDGEEHEYYAQFNSLGNINHVVVAYLDNLPVGCGAIKHYDETTAEVKRMFVSENYRGKGIARKMLAELEGWAKELLYNTFVLETGSKQPEAINLYKKVGYKVTENYGQYKGVENSICFRKYL